MKYGELIQKIRESIKYEFEDYKYYTQLAKNAPDMETNEIISGIAKDKKEHAHVLKEVYFKLTGRMPKEVVLETIDIENYNESLKKRVLLEKKDEEYYKNLYVSTQIDWIRDIFFKIMHDESECTAKLNLLLDRK